MRLARTSGFKLLDDAAIPRGRQMGRFEPFVKEGKPDEAWTLLELRFSLSPLRLQPHR